ncbi:hypothetical protein [Vitiosangium sp. GDMCC 1.1324]|uniref:hypothetical protein n=1 Tax=Vitiosangium sp. (strain GDMCC 1.1324) TaxID=2138576 RepID=UPI000D363232|nr:hypothetical protein [Vitiosangium sp. GDMCC 1.1324]PTL76527.1 hypothetical protein DAT35_48800 [Vitiosangium sp. GDMCC 1.1324]
MFRLSMKAWKRCAVVVCGAVLGLASLGYAEGSSDEEAQARSDGNVRAGADARTWRPEHQGNQLRFSCILERPGQVRRFAVTCSGTKQIDVKAADCCIPGDHWQVKVKSWDFKPNTAVATTPGSDGDFSVPARVFTYSSSRNMNALVECSYLHGVNVFPAQTDLIVETNGSTCSVEDLGLSNELDRSP